MKNQNNSRRNFFKQLAGLGLFPLLGTSARAAVNKGGTAANDIKLSLSQWALHKAIFGGLKDNNYNQWKSYLENDPDKVWQGPLHPLDFPARARELGFTALDYVNTCFFGRAEDAGFLGELKKRTVGEGMENVVLMVDEEGMLANTDSIERNQAVANHKKWFGAAAVLECASVRVNLHGFGPAEEQMKAAVASLNELARVADDNGVDLLIENHGGMSSHPEWLLETIRRADHPRIGTMVDFDNFGFSETELWDTKKRFNRYEGVEMLMPLAGSVSAKSFRFDTSGEETCIDFGRMLKIVKESGYRGYIGVEYEGQYLSEEEGIAATKKLIERYL